LAYLPHPALQLFQLIDLFRLLHSYHLSTTAIAILAKPILYRARPTNAILALHFAQGTVPALDLITTARLNASLFGPINAEAVGIGDDAGRPACAHECFAGALG
jgi:hypothetical protein